MIEKILEILEEEKKPNSDKIDVKKIPGRPYRKKDLY